MKETVRPQVTKTKAAVSSAPAVVTTLDQLSQKNITRMPPSGFPSSKMFSAGLALGSLTLITGEPGAGKSTLCLQLALNFSATAKVLYVVSEESAAQIKERGKRFGTFGDKCLIAESNKLEEIAATVMTHKPQLAVIDSLQTIVSDAVESEMGSMNQVRAITAMLMQLAKQEQVAVILIGHVTKDGSLAGPKTLEHLVDAVYYLEADRRSSYRLLRCLKNRYGEAGRVMVMQLGMAGLTEVANAATIFVQDYKPKPGSVLTVTVVDDQIFFIEVQALVTKSAFGYAKRTASGFSRSRLELLLAIMKKHLHVDLETHDIYVNIAGGFHVHEPAMDFAVVAGILSSLKEQAFPEGAVVFGEVGLSGEVRVVKDTAARLKEIEKNRHIRIPRARSDAPRANAPSITLSSVFLPPLMHKVASQVELVPCASLVDLVKFLHW